MLKHGQIRIGGKIVTDGGRVINPGDMVEYVKTHKPDVRNPYPVVFEDEQILVTEKPAGVLTIGYHKGQGESSFYKDWLQFVRERSKGNERLYIVHRLDKEVSGLLVLAKTEEVQKSLKDNWHMNEKLYYAFVEGKPPKAMGKVSSYLTEGFKEMMVSSQDASKGKLAVTQYRIMKEYPEHTLLEVRLETGRKNQIRVHMAEIGCPIVGDKRYGAKDKYSRRIRLHAFHLAFNHPVTGLKLEFISRIPRGFTTLKEEHEHYK
jgi:23S rRNA pseudouridine1911/1915/1917 synthase